MVAFLNGGIFGENKTRTKFTLVSFFLKDN